MRDAGCGIRLKRGVHVKDVVRLGFLGQRVLAHLLFKEVADRRQADHLHEIKRVRRAVQLVVPELHHEPVRHELNVLRHQLGVHADEAARQRLANELALNGHRLAHDFRHARLLRALAEFIVQQHRELGVQRLVARNELVAEREAGQQAALLQPENGAERARKKDALHAGERNEPGLERAPLVVDPALRPLRLFFNACKLLHGVEQLVATGLVLDVAVNEHAVHLRVDVFHGDLKPVKRAGFGQLHVRHEPHRQIFQHDAVAGRKERQNHGNEVALVLVQTVVPVRGVVRQVNLFRAPKAVHLLFVHAPNVVVLDGEQHVAVVALGKQQVLGFLGCRHRPRVL